MDVFQLNDICHDMELLRSEDYQYLLQRFEWEFMSGQAEKLAEIMNWKEGGPWESRTSDDCILLNLSRRRHP